MNKTDKTSLSVSLVIPIYNNEHTLFSQISLCRQVLKDHCKTYEMIVCDDKSTDGSLRQVQEHFRRDSHIRIVTHSANEGIARTVRELYSMAKHPYIILFSVDGGWDPSDIGKMIQSAYNSNADIIIGVRRKKGYSFYRRTISFLYNFLPLVFFRVQLFDIGSIKMFRNSLFIDKLLISKSVFFEAEMVIRAVKNGAIVHPEYVHHKESKGRGTGGKLLLIVFATRDLIRVWASLIRG